MRKGPATPRTATPRGITVRHQMRRFLAPAVILVGLGSHLGAAPAAPTNLVAVVNGSAVTLTWTAPPTLITGYRLQAGTAPGLSNAADMIIGATPSFSMTSVPAGTHYIRVRAIAADGESAPSDEVVATVASGGGCDTVPDAPSGLSATVSGLLVMLSWAPPVGCQPSSYVVYAGSFPGGSDAAIVNVGNVLAFSASVPPGVYYVSVVGVNARGTSAPANMVTTVVGVAPVPPTPAPTAPVPTPPTAPVPPTTPQLPSESVTFTSLRDAVPGKYFNAAASRVDPADPNRLIIAFNTGTDSVSRTTNAFSASTLGTTLFGPGTPVAMDTLRVVVQVPSTCACHIGRITYTQNGSGSVARNATAMGASNWSVADVPAPLGTFRADPSLTGTVDVSALGLREVPVAITTTLMAWASSLGSAEVSVTSADLVVTVVYH